MLIVKQYFPVPEPVVRIKSAGFLERETGFQEQRPIISVRMASDSDPYASDSSSEPLPQGLRDYYCPTGVG